MENKQIGIHFGCLAEPLQIQAGKQGFVIKDVEYLQEDIDDLNRLHFKDYFSDSEWDKILKRTIKKIVKNATLNKVNSEDKEEVKYSPFDDTIEEHESFGM
jgi:hypothetical protein